MKLSDLPQHLRDKLKAQVPARPKNKYNVAAKSARTFEGIVFDSKLECQAYIALRNNLADLKQVKLQDPFLLQEDYVMEGKKIRGIRYIADFVIGNSRRMFEDSPVIGNTLVIDVKGMATQEFKLKRKMFEKRYGKIWIIKTLKELSNIPWEKFEIKLRHSAFII